MSPTQTRAEASERTSKPRARDVKPIDGRIARGLRTRESVVSAFETLICEGGPIPTAAQVAERADVSCRSIFTHFGDMDGVVCAVAQRFIGHLHESHHPIAPDLEIEERIRSLTSQRADALEQITPLFRTASLQSPRSDSLRTILEAIRRANRAYLLALFAHELDPLAEPDRSEMAEAIIAITSWAHWNGLRQAQELPAATAGAVMHRELRALLGSLGGQRAGS